MSERTVHVVGAGLAGLAAATLVLDGADAGDIRPDARVILYEAAGQAGGRCRSYFDPGLGTDIDNGNHLVLSGNGALQRYLARVGSTDMLAGPPEAAFPFADLESGERWTVRPNDGRWPWWIFTESRRVPGTRARHYLDLAKLARAPANARVEDVIDCSGPLWHRFLRPVLLAVLNIEPARAAAGLVANVLRESIARGGAACRPLIASKGLGAAFVDPAVAALRAPRARVAFNKRLQGLVFDGDGDDTVSGLDFADGRIALGPGDAVVLAVPPWTAAELIPDLSVPTRFKAIVNAHFLCAPPPDAPALLGLIGGTAEWVFAFENRLSVTVSGAGDLVGRDRGALARALWADVAKAYGMVPALPPWQIVKERRATFQATPDQLNLRPGTRTRWRNLFLAGDWTDTGLPATIEGAVRSGERAAMEARAYPS